MGKGSVFVLCSWARHFTLTVLFYLGVQIGWRKFLGKPDEMQGGGNLAPDWHSMQGEGSNSPCHLVPLGSSTDFTYLGRHGTRLSPKRISFVVFLNRT